MEVSPPIELRRLHLPLRKSPSNPPRPESEIHPVRFNIHPPTIGFDRRHSRLPLSISNQVALASNSQNRDRAQHDGKSSPSRASDRSWKEQGQVVARIEADWHAVLAAEVRRSARLLFRLAYNVLRDRAAAEDACQHALLKAWEERERLRDPPVLRSWLARVVVNESLRLVRRRNVERKSLQLAGGAARAVAGASVESDVRESVLLALEQLPERSKAVVTLRVMQGLSGNETAELLGLSAGEVSRQLHAGMEQLRALLDDWDADAVMTRDDE